MTKRAILFVRVSTSDGRQDTRRQIDDLTKYAKERKFKVVDVIEERISGAVKNEKRRGIQDLLDRARKKSFDILLISELSRIGRSPFECQKVIEELSDLKISIHIQSLNLITLDEQGKRSLLTDFMIAVLNQVNAIERQFIVDRVKSGIAKAKSKGVHCGRPAGTSMSDKDYKKKYSKVLHDLGNGLSIRKAAKLHGVSTNTILRIKHLVPKGKAAH